MWGRDKFVCTLRSFSFFLQIALSIDFLYSLSLSLSLSLSRSLARSMTIAHCTWQSSSSIWNSVATGGGFRWWWWTRVRERKNSSRVQEKLLFIFLPFNNFYPVFSLSLHFKFFNNIRKKVYFDCFFYRRDWRCNCCCAILFKKQWLHWKNVMRKGGRKDELQKNELGK